MSAILIGYRGSGKSTIGKRLADSVWKSFADTDVLITKSAGKTIKEIFEQDGEPKFRELEVAAVRKALDMPDHVVALGGGAVLREENRKLLKSSGRKVIYLRCDPQVLLQRIQNDPETGTTRPPLTNLGGSIEEIADLLTMREPLYRLVMTSELDVTNLSPEEAVVYITRLL